MGRSRSSSARPEGRFEGMAMAARRGFRVPQDRGAPADPPAIGTSDRPLRGAREHATPHGRVVGVDPGRVESVDRATMDARKGRRYGYARQGEGRGFRAGYRRPLASLSQISAALDDAVRGDDPIPTAASATPRTDACIGPRARRAQPASRPLALGAKGQPHGVRRPPFEGRIGAGGKPPLPMGLGSANRPERQRPGHRGTGPSMWREGVHPSCACRSRRISC